MISKYNFYRAVLLMTIVLGTFFLMIDEGNSNFAAVVIFGFIVAIFIYASYRVITECKKQGILDDVLCVKFFKKIGCDFTKE